MPYVIQLQIKNPVYLAGLDPTLHRTFRRDHALVFMIPPSAGQVKHCADHFPDAHVVEVQPEQAKEEPTFPDRQSKEMHRLSDELRLAMDGLTELRRKERSVSDSLDAMTRERNDLQAENAKLKEKLAQWKAAASATFGYEETPVSLEAKMGRIIKELFTLRGEIDVKSSEISRLEYKLREREQDVTKLKDKLLAQGNQEWSDQVAALQDENATLKAELAHVDQQIPPGVDRNREGRASDVAILAASWQRLEDMIQMLSREFGITRSSASQVDVVEDRIREVKAKPAPVADAEIRRVLDVMRYTAPKEWHDTLQAVGADLVVARESLDQVTKVKDEMRDGRDSAVKVMRALTEELAQFKVTLEAVTKERDALHATEGALVRDLEVAFKERDDARAEIEQCKMSLPEELRGGSVLQGIASLIRSRTYAREQTSQYARRYAEARDERDALSSKLSKVQAMIAKAMEQ